MPEIDAPDFSLRHTLECGQYFRHHVDGGRYAVVCGDRAFTVWQEGDRLGFDGADETFIRRFFSLDHDLDAIRAAIDKDPFIHAALERYRGLRLVRQDPWECTAGFITSQVSNIPRIRRNVEDMAGAFGTVLGSRHQFPRPDQLGTEARLRDLRLGFRAKYLVRAARLASMGLLERIEGLDSDQLRDGLMTVPGIAEKVADCIALFAFGRLDAFPVDTWIRRVIQRLYFPRRKVTDAKIRSFGRDYFGSYAGYAQQYLFIWSREGGLKDACPVSPSTSASSPRRPSTRPRPRPLPGSSR